MNQLSHGIHHILPVKMTYKINLPNASVRVTGIEFNVNTYDSASPKVAWVNSSVNISVGVA